MPETPTELSEAALAFLSEYHLATLTTLRKDGSPHVVPVGFSYDLATQLVRIISFEGSVKVLNARRGGRAAVCQVDGPRWLTFEGEVSATSDADRVAAAVAGYAARYRQPKERADRVAIEIRVDRVLGHG